MFKVEDTGIYYRITINDDYGKRMVIATDTVHLEDMLVQLGASIGDLEYMLNTFEDKGHNYAEFGRYGGFVFSRFDGVNH